MSMGEDNIKKQEEGGMDKVRNARSYQKLGKKYGRD